MNILCWALLRCSCKFSIHYILYKWNDVLTSLVSRIMNQNIFKNKSHFVFPHWGIFLEIASGMIFVISTHVLPGKIPFLVLRISFSCPLFYILTEEYINCSWKPCVYIWLLSYIHSQFSTGSFNQIMHRDKWGKRINKTIKQLNSQGLRESLFRQTDGQMESRQRFSRSRCVWRCS